MSDIDLLRTLSNARATLLTQLGRHEEAREVRNHDWSELSRNQTEPSDEGPAQASAEEFSNWHSESRSFSPMEYRQFLLYALSKLEGESGSVPRLDLADSPPGERVQIAAPLNSEVDISSDGEGHLVVEVTVASSAPQVEDFGG